MDEYELYVHAGTSQELSRYPDLVVEAQDRLRSLLGESPPGSDALYERHEGPCHVCGQQAKLTYEHLPPRSAFNDYPVRIAEFKRFLHQRLGFFPRSGWKPQQRGAGLYSTCADCNSFSGREYVPAYSEFTKIVGFDILDLSRSVEEKNAVPPPGIRLQFRQVQLGRIVRQGLYMTLAANGNSILGEEYPVLREVVPGERRTLPTNVRVLLTATISQAARITPLHAMMDYRRGKSWAAVEVAYYPFAWVLEIGDSSGSNMADMSFATELELDDAIDFTIELPVGYLKSPIPCDYRSPAEIESDPQEDVT